MTQPDPPPARAEATGFQPTVKMLDAGEAVLIYGPHAGGPRSQAFLTWRVMERARLDQEEQV